VIPARLLGTGSALPARRVTTAEVAARVGKDAAEIEARTGIRTRFWAEPGATMADLGAEALRRALAAAGMPAAELRRLIFVSTTGGDYTTPATANSILHALGVDHGRCDAFDLANACVGFLTALDLGARSVATGTGPVGIVVVELMTRFISPDDARPYVIFGDAAGAVVLGPGRPDEGLAGVALGNEGARGGTVVIHHPALTGKAEHFLFAASSREMNQIATEAMIKSAAAALDQAGVTLEEVAWFLPHQPNGRMLEGLVDAFRVDRGRVVPVVEEIGSVGAASIPVSLDRLLRSGRVQPGDRMLMVSVGSGLAYGAVIYQVAGSPAGIRNVRQ
jgi:3-oxoacyl-(acyl-carrier-protein) synthase III